VVIANGIASDPVPVQVVLPHLGSDRPMTSWVQSDGPHVCYGDANGGLYQLWYTVKTGQWAAQGLMNVPNAVAVGALLDLNVRPTDYESGNRLSTESVV
jgi:hypothetical protein